MKKIDLPIQDKIDKISKVHLFENLTNSEIKGIAQIMTSEFYEDGEIIIKEGDIGDCCYILHNGIVTVLKETFAKEQYAVAQINEKDNAFFGEMALIDKDARTATIKASTEVTVLVLSSLDFENFVEQNYKSGYYILKAIAKNLIQRLKGANRDIATLFGALEEEIEEEK
ncbi:MAG: cyclic nucleotide-binding domain-containing protein [Spirochaetes bacterium]|nr:cyclic nucleotide-binding domain-containing protein [Spirochaetota bacterium]NLJ05766.1 cyclic nucleotide-binding domain-containing protein [Exilispira sp.]MBP8991315.1 cyclic nucleotide-binding domain-containing protein [Spirochaetota bacterium]HNV44395.1 cyclic nucleotide-binding domain-containing protein [Exilispira sp.]HPB47146.1 cyclic nucleotide-binding domain-containing protein [Exilispira sp.]